MENFPEIIILSMAKGWGGAEEYLELLRRALVKRGFSHRLFIREGKEYARRGKMRDTLHEAPYSASGYLSFLSKQRLVGSGRKVVHVHRYYDILRGWTIKRKVTGSKLVLYQQCYLNHPNSLPLSMTDGILCISDFVKGSITSRFPELEEKIAVINPGVDLALFDRAKTDYETEGPVKIGMVGRFDKNQEELLEIGGMLKRKGFSISIHLVGEGVDGEEDNLRSVAHREGIGGEIHFRGKVPHEQIPVFYMEMDIMASTMKNEGLSLVAMEAMASGVPFVAYGSSGFAELIDHGENGILVDGDANEFAECLTKLIESEDLRKEMGTRAAGKGKSHFGMDINVEKYLSFLEKLFD